MNVDNNKNLFVKNVLLTFAAFVIYKIIGSLVISHIEKPIVNVFVSEVTILSCAMLLAIVTKKMYALKMTRNKFGRGIFVGLYIVVIDTLGILYYIYHYVKDEQVITISNVEIILFALSMVMVGVAEELMFRGVLLNVCLDFFGENSVSSIRKSIIISSSIFGAFHIFNVLVGASLSGSIVQAVNAIAIGILLGAVYVRSDKNIWPCVVIHGFHDCVSFMQSGVLTGNGVKDAVSSYTASMLPSIFVFLLVGLFVMRKKKMSMYVK